MSNLFFMPRRPRDELPFHQGVCQCPTFDETPLPIPDVDSDDEDFLPTADLGDLVWSEEPVPNRWEYMCIHQILRPAAPSLQPNQVEMPPEPEQIDIDIPQDLQDLINVPKELLSDIQCARLPVVIDLHQGTEDE